MSLNQAAGATRDRRPLVAAVVLIPIVIALAVAAFAWPAARLAPRDLPVGVAGPAPAADAVAERFAAEDGAFDVHRYADEAAARTAIEDREVYGAIVAGRDGSTVLTASAASPLVAQLLQQSAARAGGPAPRVVDVVAADPDDPRGAAFNASVLPLVLAGVAIGIVISLISRAGLEQAGALVAASVLTGSVAVGVAQGWLGILGGNWLVNAGVLSLVVLAIGATIAGLYALLGRAGLPLGALLMVFVGNPFSGVATAPELLPQGVAVIGQLLPPGAGGTLLRSTAFFDGAGGAYALTVLLTWSVLGLAAVALGALRTRRAPALLRAADPTPVAV
jgi:hypothetical protein